MKPKNILALFLLLSAFPLTASAYIDPGAGSYLFQLFLGALFGVLIFFKSFQQKFFSIFRRTKKTSDEKSAEEK